MKTISYGRQHIDGADIREVVKILKSDYLTQGATIAKFEDGLCKVTNAKYAVAVSHGTAALHLACLAAGIKHGDEVVTSAITFAASSNSVLYCGAKPVFSDVESTTGNVTVALLEEKITRKTKAIIPVHYAGNPVNCGKIYAMAKKRKLVVIEDACHALGASYKVNGNNFKIGCAQHADMVCFSFHPVKSITTGEGGAILTNNKKFYEKLILLRNHGITKDRSQFISKDRNLGDWYYEMQALGFNYRITDIQCALGISQLKKLNTFIKQRRSIVKRYTKGFETNPYFDLPAKEKGCQSAWHLYPILLNDQLAQHKAEIVRELKRNRIFTQVHYIPVYQNPYYQSLGYKTTSCSEAEKFYKRVLSLPIYPDLTVKEQNYVIKKVLMTLKKYQ